MTLCFICFHLITYWLRYKRKDFINESNPRGQTDVWNMNLLMLQIATFSFLNKPSSSLMESTVYYFSVGSKAYYFWYWEFYFSLMVDGQIIRFGVSVNIALEEGHWMNGIFFIFLITTSIVFIYLYLYISVWLKSVYIKNKLKRGRTLL